MPLVPLLMVMLLSRGRSGKGRGGGGGDAGVFLSFFKERGKDGGAWEEV